MVGDRTDELIEKLGEIGARDADVVAIAHKERYLRGRTVEELDGLMRAGAERVGVDRRAGVRDRGGVPRPRWSPRPDRATWSG